MMDEAKSELLRRRHETFSMLADAEIARIRRCGSARHCAPARLDVSEIQ